jgi:hypothetical protein
MGCRGIGGGEGEGRGRKGVILYSRGQEVEGARWKRGRGIGGGEGEGRGRSRGGEGEGRGRSRGGAGEERVRGRKDRCDKSRREEGQKGRCGWGRRVKEKGEVRALRGWRGGRGIARGMSRRGRKEGYERLHT